MNETVNLHLPQFEATDRILHDDFNDAFQKLDAAVKANSSALAAKANSSTVTALGNRVSAVESGKADAAVLSAETAARQAGDLWVKVCESTMQSASMTHQLSNFSAANYQQLKLIFRMTLPYTAAYPGNPIRLTLNNITTQNYWVVELNKNSNSDNKYAYMEIFPIDGGPAGGEVLFFPLGTTGTGAKFDTVVLQSVSSGLKSCSKMAGTGSVAFSSLSSIQITATAAAMPSGSYFALYGLKK